MILTVWYYLMFFCISWRKQWHLATWYPICSLFLGLLWSLILLSVTVHWNIGGKGILILFCMFPSLMWRHLMDQFPFLLMILYMGLLGKKKKSHCQSEKTAAIIKAVLVQLSSRKQMQFNHPSILVCHMIDLRGYF